MGKGGGSRGGGGSAVALEPIKSADQTMREASSSASRAQQLRRGLASTFSREGMGAAPSGGGTSGAARKLGE